jgi:hypothetical protein
MTADGEIDPVPFAKLQRLARSHPRSGRESVAKASAIRTLNGWLGMGAGPGLSPCPPGRYSFEQAGMRRFGNECGINGMATSGSRR